MCVNHPRAGLPLDEWKSCISIIFIFVIVFVTITVIKSGSGICSSVHLRSQEVGEGSRLHSRFSIALLEPKPCIWFVCLGRVWEKRW